MRDAANESDEISLALDATYSLGRDLSGVGIYSRELMRALAKAQPDADWRWLYRPHRWIEARREALPPRVSRGLLLDRALWRSADLFHGMNQRLPTTRFRRQVVTFHDLFVMTAEYSTPEFRARFTGQARHAALSADHIIAVSRFTASQVTGLLQVEPSRVSVVPHGVRELRLPQTDREPVVLHTGSIQKRKNLIRLVRAFRAVPAPWRLVLAGSDGFEAAAVYDAIARSPVHERIVTTGYLNEADLDRWYARASIFAFPSLDEGFGMPVLEAMTAGIPVLASDTSAVGETAGDAALKVDPNSEDALASGLLRLVDDNELRLDLIARGYSRAREFTWGRCAAETLDVYRKFIHLP